MGTLFEQTPRNYDMKDHSSVVLDEIRVMKDWALKMGITYNEVLETCKMLEIRRKNNLYVMNGDAFDEQISGIGFLLQEFIQNFRKAFAVSSTDDSPSALEALSMTLGYENPCAIAGAIESITESIENYIEKKFD